MNVTAGDPPQGWDERGPGAARQRGPEDPGGPGRRTPTALRGRKTPRGGAKVGPSQAVTPHSLSTEMAQAER